MEYENVQHGQIQGIRLLVDDITYRAPHMHREFEMMLVLRGKIQVATQNKYITLPEGDCIVLNPWYTHEFHCDEESATALFLQVSPNVIKGYFPMAGALRFEQIGIAGAVPEKVMQLIRTTMMDFGISLSGTWFDTAICRTFSNAASRLVFIPHSALFTWAIFCASVMPLSSIT